MHFILFQFGAEQKKLGFLAFKNDLYSACPFLGLTIYIKLSDVTKALYLIIILCVYLFRFNGGKFYTYIGEVCVSVNPYRTLNIYGPDYVSQYKGNFFINY